jgi:hypothetical protein
MSGIICVHPQSSLPAIQVVQNTYSDLGLTQTLERDGSEWTRSVLNDSLVEQSFSEFYGESVSSTLVLVSASTSDALLGASQSSTIVFTETVTVAGGRTDSGGGGGGGDNTSNTFTITYDSGGPSAVEGMVVYIDPADGEAKLAASDSTEVVAEVAGFLTAAYVAGDTASVVTEGDLTLEDWTDVAGTATLTPGATYYLHTDGEIRVTPPETGKLVIVGRAMTTLSLDIEINLPWGL